MSSTQEDKVYSYLFFRTDLTPQQQIIQTVHAGMQMAFAHEEKSHFTSQVPNIVLVACEDEQALLGVQAQLECDCVAHTPFYEPDIGMSLTSIACAPLRQKDKTKFLRKQKLA